jgi:hypothetical protein
MPATNCITFTPITVGDAVCVIGLQLPAAPIVARATATNLATSQTVLGVAQATANPVPPMSAPVQVWVAGDVVPANTGPFGLGPGATNIVAVDAHAHLVRVPRPDGSEFVVGHCDVNGHTIVVPRASRDASTQMVFNVRSFGAVPDGRILSDCMVDAAANTLTATLESPFTRADIGKTIVIGRAGAHETLLRTTIVGVVEPFPSNTVNLDPASPAVTSVVAPDTVTVSYGTDCLPAFKACQAMMSASLVGDEQRGAIFFVPPLDSPADRYYFLSDEFELLCQARYEGTGVGGDHSGSRILLAQGAGFRIRGFDRASVLGDSTNALLSGFDITCMPDHFLRWAPNTPVWVGQKFRFRCRSGVERENTGNGEWIVHYEVIRSGITHVDPNAEPDPWTAGCVMPDLSIEYPGPGQQVKRGTLVRSSDPANQHIIFEQLNGGGGFQYVTTGPGPVPWTSHDGDLIPDGGALWQAKLNAACIFQDGTAVFACKTAAAIHAVSPCYIERNYVRGCLGAAIHITSSSLAPTSNANRSCVERCDVATPRGQRDPAGRPWGGVGFAIYGGESSAMNFVANHVVGNDNENDPYRVSHQSYALGDRVIARYALEVDQRRHFVHFECVANNAGASVTAGLEPAFNYALGEETQDGGIRWMAVPAPPNYGFYDAGNLGNDHYGGYAEECSGPGFALLSSGGAGGTYGCYSENMAGDVYWGHNAIYGGHPTAGTILFEGTSTFYGQIVNARAVSGAVGRPGWVGKTDLAGLESTTPESFRWRSEWWTDDNWRLPVTETGGQYLALGRDGFWRSHAGGSAFASAWGWSTNQARLADGTHVGSNVFQLARCFLFGNETTEPPFVWFASPANSAASAILGGYRRVGDRRCKAAAGAAPGSYVDQVVTTAGYDGPAWAPAPKEYQAGEPLGASSAMPPDVIVPPGSTLAYVCTRTGTAGVAPPAWPPTVVAPGMGARTWTPSMYVRVGDWIRPTAAPQPGGNVFQVTAIDVDFGDGVWTPVSIRQTGDAEPLWAAVPFEETWPAVGFPRTRITYGASQLDDAEGTTWIRDAGVVWTCIGTTARWSDANLVLAGSRTSAVDYTLLTNDRHVTFTVGGNRARLPTDPTDGQTHSVKSGGAFTTTVVGVELGVGKQIDGQDEVLQVGDYVCTTVRFNALTDQWERI